MAKWEARTNCEYILQVEADSSVEAIRKANEIDLDEWEHSWSEIETAEVKGQ